MKNDPKSKDHARRANEAWKTMGERINHLVHVHDHEIHGVSEIHEALLDVEEGVRGVRLIVEEAMRERGTFHRSKPKLRLVSSRRRRRPSKAFERTKKNFEALKAHAIATGQLQVKVSKKEFRKSYEKAVAHALFEKRTQGEWTCMCDDCSIVRYRCSRDGDLCPSCGCPASEEAPKGCGAHLV